MTQAGPDALPPEPALREAALALNQGRLEDAEVALRQYLQASPRNPNALRMLAEVAARANSFADAAGLLEECLEIAPQFIAARYRLATLLFRMNKPHRALEEIETLLADDPGNFECLSLKSVVLARMGDYAAALSLHERLIRDHPDKQGIWLNYAAELKAAGRGAESIAAYRAAIARFPHLVEAYWSLGNNKTFRFAPTEIEAMQAELARTGLSETDRCLLHFTLGKAAEDAKDYAPSFEHYAKANAIRRAQTPYDADETSGLFARIRAVFTPEFLKEREGRGCAAPDPIFVVGLPRSGSTLIEQILSSHSQIEATMELLNVPAIIDRLDGPYPEALPELDGDLFEALGEEYIEETRPFRNLGRALFIDKMPENFRHIGLIHLMLPNAKIIDARRHPLACGISNFRQDFESDYAFTYDLKTLGRYWRDYAELMAHWDRVLPGKVHRVFHEKLIAEPETEIRRMLDYLGLPFEESCLRFYENDRPVLTASSEQVRQPIFKTQIEQWQHYEPWLGPLKQALGPALTGYPA
ncbi:MAG TPA: sulfotransferase [Rhizomicrobium sp.]|nr:sulfotransferase [Rhizomicrobium sp.]